MDQDFFETEMTKALEEIFSNLRQLRESRSQKRLSMDTDKNEEEDESPEHVKRTENFETYPLEPQEKHDADIVTVKPQVPEIESENKLSSKDTDFERTFDNVETYSEKRAQEKESTAIVSEPQVPQSPSIENRPPSKATKENELETEPLANAETTGKVRINNPQREPEENQNTDDVTLVKPQGPRRRRLPVLPTVKNHYRIF